MNYMEYKLFLCHNTISKKLSISKRGIELGYGEQKLDNWEKK